MRATNITILLIFAVVVTSCKKKQTEPAQTTATNTTSIPTSTTTNWVQVTPNDSIFNYINLYATDSKLYSTSPGTLFSSADGIAWTDAQVGDACCVEFSGNNSYMGRTNGFYISTDNGTSWAQKNNGLTNLNVYKIFPRSTGLYIATSGGLFFSSDNGDNWVAAGLASNNYITDVAVLNNKLYAAANSSLFTSTDNGNSWSIITGSIASTFVVGAVVSGNNVLIPADAGVFISSDNGTNWSLISGLTPYTFLIARDNHLIAMNGNTTLKYSSDNGVTWTPFTDGLPFNRLLDGYAINSTHAFVVEKNSKKIYKRKF